MARQKGKSNRRIKNWRQRRRAGEQVGAEADDEVSRKQRVSRPGVKLPPARLAAPGENLEDLPKVEGMVVGIFPGGAAVRTGGDELLCGIAGTFRAPAGSSALAVGDDVTVALRRREHADRSEGDKNRADGLILTRRPRSTALCRPQARSGKRRGAHDGEAFEKVVAANIDVLLIVTSTCGPRPRQGVVDRFLIVAERGELEPLLVVNKVDLAPPDERILADFRMLGHKAFCCSALKGEGIAPIADALAGRRSVLAGASGVGKSTLINAMLPGAKAATQSIRMKDQRGRHTTSATVVYDLPPRKDGQGAGMLLDTPGVRELGVNLSAVELPWYFPEFEPLAGQCRFNNCTHTHEPGCAVIAAVDEDRILRRRYESYLHILATLDGA